jgi:DNA repair protein RecN (Recombination protein N)
MLSSIHIRDLVIVSALELELRPGMTVLTGETGAGKSILIDALGLVLGDRADGEMIREGCSRAEITADFDLADHPAIREWLVEHELDSDGECMLRRVLSRKGSSRAFINGSAVPVKQLQALGEQLVDIHGQHAHQSLMRRDQQRILLDDYAGLAGEGQQIAALFHQWREKAEALESLRSASRERFERLDLLRFQVEELEELDIKPGELQELEAEHLRLSNADRLREGCTAILEMLYDGERTTHSSLSWAAGELEEFTTSDPQLAEPRGLLEEAAIQVEEAGRGLRAYLDELELDPERLAQLEERLSAIHTAARKFRRRPQELHELLEDLRGERGQLENADVHLADLEKESESLRQEYLAQADALDRQRRKAAKRLQQEVSEAMVTLGMPGGRLEIQVETLEEAKASASGLNRVEFRVAANPGQSPQPLAKTASGGELSRISLAIQVATAQCNGTPTLIFDEVDVGIGGGVAEIVGKLLRELGDRRQVLCVTHLAQVASQGHNHLKVAKYTQEGQTFTQITPLDPHSRVEEVARMLGGIEITENTLAHAREMLERAASDKD